MFIEVVIDGIIFNRLQVDLAMTGFVKEEIDRRQRLVNAYLELLKERYPNSSLQLSFESKIHLIDENEDGK